MSTADVRGDGAETPTPSASTPTVTPASPDSGTTPSPSTPPTLPPEEAAPPAAPPPIPLSGRRGGRRRRLAVAGGVAAAALVGLGVLAWRNDSDDGSDSGDTPAAATATAEVTTRDLEERTDLSGTLGYGDTHEIALEAQGTLTWLPAEGTVIDRGQTVAEVDDKPIPLLLGDRPLWRELGPEVDDGRDVEMVESNLVALGIVSADDLTVDQDWTSATTEAVEDWQESLGLEQTGRLRPSDVVVQPAAVRVTDQMAEPGGPASGPALTVGGTTRQVTVDIDATRQQMVQVGQKVEVELPDGSKTNGTISVVGTVAETPVDDSGQEVRDATPTVSITVTLDDPAAGGTLDQAPVKVWVVTSSATGVLAVPVDALLALAEGGYAVERVVPGGSELVAVEIGAFADGWVQVTGDVADGDKVVVPA